MAEHKIPMHPLDELDLEFELKAALDFENMDTDEQRYIAEHGAVKIDNSSSVENCARAISMLAAVHIPQLNARLKDKNANRHYDNPIELIQEESKRRENKKIWYTGNIADTHAYLEKLNSQIVSEATPDEMKKSLFWCVLLGLGFLALGIYSWMSNIAVDALLWIINSQWFMVLFILVTLALSLFFGFFSIGVLLVGVLMALAWILFEMPGIAAFVVNGVIILIGAFFFLCAWIAVDEIKKYKPLTEEEHQQNQERIAEKEALRQELKEYSEAMLGSLRIMKDKFMDQEQAFHNEMNKYLGYAFGIGAVYEIFSFLERYYRKMTR